MYMARHINPNPMAISTIISSILDSPTNNHLHKTTVLIKENTAADVAIITPNTKLTKSRMPFISNTSPRTMKFTRRYPYRFLDLYRDDFFTLDFIFIFPRLHFLFFRCRLLVICAICPVIVLEDESMYDTPSLLVNHGVLDNTIGIIWKPKLIYQIISTKSFHVNPSFLFYRQHTYQTVLIPCRIP
mgnify:CR=1 FL=1